VERIALAAAPGESIGILGLSFKPESDDVRDSPAAKIIARLLELGYCDIYAYDPVANDAFNRTYHFAGVTYCTAAWGVCERCECVAVVTTWAEFKGIDLKYPQSKWIDCRYFL
jgi:UDPglucose 6-dehydrogenase